SSPGIIAVSRLGEPQFPLRGPNLDFSERSIHRRVRRYISHRVGSPKFTADLLVQRNDVFQSLRIKNASTGHIGHFFHATAYARQITIGNARFREDHLEAAVFISSNRVGLEVSVSIECDEVSRNTLGSCLP